MHPSPTQPILSGEQVHVCEKPGCHFCYEATRKHIDWYMPLDMRSPNCKQWTDEENDILLKNHNIPTLIVQSLLPKHRTILAIQWQLYRVRKANGIIAINQRKYTERENTVICDNPRLTSKELIPLLPDRTYGSIMNHRTKLRKSGECKIFYRAYRVRG